MKDLPDKLLLVAKIILELYQDFIPESPNINAFETSSDPDLIAVSILKFFHPVILNNLMPWKLLFRAVSKAIYGHQEKHFRLRYFQP